MSDHILVQLWSEESAVLTSLEIPKQNVVP